MKELSQNLHRTNLILVDDIEQQLTKLGKELKYLLKREHQLRDLNETIFEKLTFFALLFLVILSISQIVVFISLRRFFAKIFQ